MYAVGLVLSLALSRIVFSQTLLGICYLLHSTCEALLVRYRGTTSVLTHGDPAVSPYHTFSRGHVSGTRDMSKYNRAMSGHFETRSEARKTRPGASRLLGTVSRIKSQALEVFYPQAVAPDRCRCEADKSGCDSAIQGQWEAFMIPTLFQAFGPTLYVMTNGGRSTHSMITLNNLVSRLPLGTASRVDYHQTPRTRCSDVFLCHWYTL